jgi:hypothetical protein
MKKQTQKETYILKNENDKKTMRNETIKDQGRGDGWLFVPFSWGYVICHSIQKMRGGKPDGRDFRENKEYLWRRGKWLYFGLDCVGFHLLWLSAETHCFVWVGFWMMNIS